MNKHGTPKKFRPAGLGNRKKKSIMKELQKFKTEINLTEYAASHGYCIDKGSSSRSSATMRSAGGDKIIVSRSMNGDWVYFSVKDDGDNGTVIDFVQHREGGSLGEVRKTLRAWLGSPRPMVPVKNYSPALIPLEKDLTEVLKNYETANYTVNVPYLAARGLNADVLKQKEFMGRFKIDRRNNALFPHYNQNGLCGYEMKNTNFTGFASGGIKGLWYSLCRKTDKKLVFTESAIDGISYHVLNPDPDTRYMSTGGSMNPQQPELIRAAIKHMPKGSVLVLAFDNDDGGEKLTEEVKKIIPEGVEHLRPLPPVGTDWNDTLKNQLGL